MSTTFFYQIELTIAVLKILQGIGEAQAAVTERWPLKEEKMRENHFFFRKKIEIF